MTENEIRIEYERLRPLYQKLRDETVYILENELTRANIKVTGVLGRVKTLDSLLEKVERKQIRGYPFNELQDLCGTRVVCLFLSQLSDIDRVIRDNFRVQTSENRLDTMSENEVGYLSVHYIVRLPSTYAGPRYDNIRELLCEIQVRTISMDAWANVSHSLSYKHPVDVPKELRRAFFALSGLFYVADTQFETFYKAVESMRREVQIQANSGTSLLQEDLNNDTLRAFLQATYPARRQTEDVSELLGELWEAGYRNVGQLKLALDRGWSDFIEYENIHPPEGSKGSKYTTVGLVRVTLEIIDEKFAGVRPFALHRKRHSKLRNGSEPVAD